MTPHKHAELIKAWADGAEIQIKYNDGWCDWCIGSSPHWLDDEEYRLKPKHEFVPVLHIDFLLSLAREMEYAFQNESNIEGRVWANRLIKYIREGETGALKGAEVLK